LYNIVITSSSAIAERPCCMVGRFWPWSSLEVLFQDLRRDEIFVDDDD